MTQGTLGGSLNFILGNRHRAEFRTITHFPPLHQNYMNLMGALPATWAGRLCDSCKIGE
jgi:hypothetical protein